MDETIEPLIKLPQDLTSPQKGPSPKQKKGITFGNIEVDTPIVQAFMAVIFCTFLVVISFLRLSVPLQDVAEDQEMPPKPTYVNVETGNELIDSLKEFGLWEINDKKQVPAVVFSGFPENIDQLDIALKKKGFIHALIPAALIALAEVESEKKALETILARFPEGYKDLVFSDDFAAWGRVLTMDEIEFVLMLTRKYRTNRALELSKRIDLVPLSLIIAQGAIESSWGTSRFAQLGNNLFGIWTWGEKGIVPAGREEGKRHKVASYDTIIDSIRAYIIMLNRLPAYRNFRQIRSKTKNPIKLADGLLYYSERRDSYVWELKNIIRFNNLTVYDGVKLLDTPVTSLMLDSAKIIALNNKNAA